MKLPDFLAELSAIKYDLPDAEYRSAPGVSNSMLLKMSGDGQEPGSPNHFRAQFEEEQEDADAMFLGRSIHSRVLTPDAPLEGMIAIPDEYSAPADSSLVKQKKVAVGDMIKWSGNAKYCKNWKAQQEALGKRPMTASELRMVDGIVNSIANDETCRLAFKEGKAEVSLWKPYYRNDGMVLRKARLDWVSAGPSICDVKSCQDARAHEFGSTVWKRGYFRQSAYYLDAWNELNPNEQKESFIFIAAEKFPPYAIQVFALRKEDIESGRKAYQKDLNTLIHCIKHNEWPAYAPGVQELKMNAPYRKLLD